MVKQTTALQKIRFALMKKQEFERKGVYKVNKTPAWLKKTLDEKNVTVVDAFDKVSIRERSKIPTEVASKIPPDFRNVWYQKEPDTEEKETSFFLPNSATFSEGIKQACILTKTQAFKGLPKAIHVLQRKVDTLPLYLKEAENEKAGLYQQAIMQSQIWDPTWEKLPKRRDPDHMGWVFRREFGIPDGASAKILLNNLLLAASRLSRLYPELTTDRHKIYKPEIDMDYDYLGNTIIVRAIGECLTYGREPLKPFLAPRWLESSKKYEMPSMDPILPTIDLEETTMAPRGTAGGLLDMTGVECSHPHTLYRGTGDMKRMQTLQGYNLMLTHAMAVTEARNRYGITEGVLPEPVTVQNVSLTYNRAHYVFFQLNTLDTTTKDGVKNFAWFHHGKMFKRVKPQPWKEKNRRYNATYYEDLELDPYKTFLAVYLNGVGNLDKVDEAVTEGVGEAAGDPTANTDSKSDSKNHIEANKKT